MITGSHIPDDRNGIKFNMPWGEILKEDEVEISERYKEIKEKLKYSRPDLWGERLVTGASTRSHSQQAYKSL